MGVNIHLKHALTVLALGLASASSNADTAMECENFSGSYAISCEVSGKAPQPEILSFLVKGIDQGHVEIAQTSCELIAIGMDLNPIGTIQSHSFEIPLHAKGKTLRFAAVAGMQWNKSAVQLSSNTLGMIQVGTKLLPLNVQYTLGRNAVDELELSLTGDVADLKFATTCSLKVN